MLLLIAVIVHVVTELAFGAVEAAEAVEAGLVPVVAVMRAPVRSDVPQKVF